MNSTHPIRGRAVNLSILYVGAVVINAVFDYRSYVKKNSMEKKKVLEADAREADAEYYHSCLSGKYPQQFFPNLLRQTVWKSIGLKHSFMPLGAQPEKSLSYCNEGYGFVKYTSDRYGFRNTDSAWDSEVDILLIGDSFMQGACVPNNKHVAGVINDKTQLNAITLGMGSNGPQHYVALIEKFVPFTNSKYVVLAFYPNDNHEVLDDDYFLMRSTDPAFDGYFSDGLSANGVRFFEEASHLIKVKEDAKKYDHACHIQGDYYLRHNDLAARNKELYYGLFDLGSFRDWLLHKRFFNEFDGVLSLQYIREILFSNYSNNLAVQKKELENLIPNVTKLAINTLIDKCLKACTPVILLLPNSDFWRADDRADRYLSGIVDYIKYKHSNKSYILVDARDVISSDDLDSFSPTGPHYSIQGYQHLTDAILKAIASHDE